LLEAARREGEALVVAVNSDVSVRRLGKGPDRPINGEAARARVVAGFAAVDCVVLFDGETPLDVIQTLAPDILVKGADYSRDAIVGADWVEARGGRVVRIPLVAGFSTTSIMERLRASS
jgi:rfaE bifunctional protein nucleotidyltransferase chain/domain